jgi:hypothetical protein
MRRGVLGGAAAAAAWAAAEPIASHVFGTTYSDVRLLGRSVSRRRWRPAGFAVHLANGALFGAVFETLGGKGARAGVVAAEVENLVLWPGMAVVDRFHPDRRTGAWPPLFGNGRVFAQEVVMHALFGAVLGAVVRERRY